jgi:hypothetical protein
VPKLQKAPIITKKLREKRKKSQENFRKIKQKLSKNYQPYFLRLNFLGTVNKGCKIKELI